MLTSPSSTPDSVRDLAAELNIDLPPRDHVAVDHFNHDTLSENPNHNLILVPRPTQSSKTQNYFGSSSNPIAFRGAGHSIGNRPLLFPVLSGSRTAYTYDTKKEKEFLDDAWAAGTQMQYITAFQARNNARIAISGSVEMFSDEFYTMTVKGVNGEETQTGNKDFAKDLTKWTFKETGVVKTVAIRHHLAGNASEVEINPMVYRIKNDVVSFSVDGIYR